MMRHIRLLIFDLDYLVFDCALLKLRALRQGLASLADDLPQSLPLPDAADIEEAYRNHGFQWIRYLEDELGEQKCELLRKRFSLNANRLLNPNRNLPKDAPRSRRGLTKLSRG